MVDLNQIRLATEEDKKYRIDYWARIFKAKVWEELQMMAKENDYMQEATEALYVANADEIVRQQCIAREDAERRERTLERKQRLLQEELKKKVEELEGKDKGLRNQRLLQEELKKKVEELEEKDKELERLRKLLASK